MMKLWRWTAGRQANCEYEKFPLWYFRIWKFGFDAYILKYKPNTVLDWHKDPVENGKHFRCNIKLQGKNTFLIKEDNAQPVILNDRMIFFRPDLFSHSLSTSGNKNSVKLSFGFVKYK